MQPHTRSMLPWVSIAPVCTSPWQLAVLLAAMARGCGQWLPCICAKGQAACLTGCRAACCHMAGLQESVYAMGTEACTVPHRIGHTLVEAPQFALHMGCCYG